MDHLSLSLFGHFQLSINQQELHTFTSEKGQMLLAYLVLENQQTHSRKKLSTLFWPNANPKSAQNSLRQTLYRLKTAFVENSAFDRFISSNRQSIRFDASSSHWTDVNEFQQLIAQRKVGNVEFEEKVQLYERLSRLYRGEFLTGMSVDDSAELEGWLHSRRMWFHNQGLETLHKLIQAHSTQGHLDLAQVYADRLLTLDPLNESAFEQKISILLQKGQSAEASSAYEQFKSRHLQQIGIEPNSAIKALLHNQPSPQRIAASRSPHVTETTAHPIPAKNQEPPKTFPLPPLPAHHVSFLQDGLSLPGSLQAFIKSSARQTLLIHGLPGAGKTVLAAEIARQIATQRPVIYLDFKRLKRERCEQIIRQLQGHPVIVLDHLDRVPQLANLISDIFSACDRATVIGVSRMLPKLNRPDTIPLECNGLNQPQASRLMFSHANGALHEPAAGQIASLLAGHPAAMLELLRWNQIFPWEMIVQKIQFGEFLWDETPLADWFETVWQSLSESEIHFAQQYAQNEHEICAEELGVMPLSSARAAMRFVERSLIKRGKDGKLRFQPIFTHWAQAKINMVESPIDRLESIAPPAHTGQLYDDQFHAPSHQIGTFE